MHTALPAFDIDSADMLTCEHVGFAELSLWFSAAEACFVVVLNDQTLLAVFDEADQERAMRYYADVHFGLLCAHEVP